MRCIIVVTLILSLLSGCASLSNRQKTIMLMGAAGAVGGTVGYATAPTDEKPVFHAGLWGGLSAATAGLIGLFLFDAESPRREAEEKVARLEREVSAMKDEQEPELISANRMGLRKPLPEKFRHLITPADWSLYKVDRWVSSGESELVHQDFLFRYQQPQINPNVKHTETPVTKVATEGGK